MRIDDPLGGISSENYRQAFDPSGESYMLNGPFEKAHDQVFEPQLINENKNAIMGAGVILVLIFTTIYFLRKA